MFKDIINSLIDGSGFAHIQPLQIVMILLACFLLYLGISRKFEPLLLVGIAFGMLLTNLPISGIYTPDLWLASKVDYARVLSEGGLIDVLYIGVKTGLYPCLIFIGVGAMTDFEPLIANPKSLTLGAAAQLGIYCAFILAIAFGFKGNEAAAIGIIGGADGPTAIWLTNKIAPELLGPIAIAAYSYMALIPLIQPPLMKLITTKKERSIVMVPSRKVTKREKIIFPIAVTIITVLILPSVAPLIGCLMFGNLLRESGVTQRLSDTVQNSLMNTVVIFLGICVGATARFDTFLQVNTLLIIALGLFAFCFSTVGGLLFGKLLCKITKGKVNPLIGAAGVSAVPMAARVAHVQGQKDNPENYLLMHAMGPNVAGVIGSAVAAGILMAVFGAVV